MTELHQKENGCICNILDQKYGKNSLNNKVFIYLLFLLYLQKLKTKSLRTKNIFALCMEMLIFLWKPTSTHDEQSP